MRKRIKQTILVAVNNFIHRMDEGNSPRWIIYLLDLLIAEFSIILAFLLRFNFEFPPFQKNNLFLSMGVILVIRGLVSAAFRSYAHVIRHTSTMDILRLVLSVLTGSSLLVIYTIIARNLGVYPVLPLSIIILEAFLTLYLMTNMRLSLKFIYRRAIPPLQQSNSLLIIGSKEKAVFTREALELDRNNRNRVIGFVDTLDLVKKNRLAGLPLFKLGDLEQLIVRFRIHAVILAKPEILERQTEEIATLCNDYNIKLLYAPDGWMNSELPKIEMKEVNIEELLTRDPINLDKKHLHKAIKGKTVLVTGAAGSIGSELVRQISRYHPKHLILLDQSETPLYQIELELREELKFLDYSIVLADISNQIRIEKVFDVFRPQIVYHAAAYCRSSKCSDSD